MAQTLLDSRLAERIPSVEEQVNAIFTVEDFAPYDNATNDLMTLAVSSTATAWQMGIGGSAESLRDEMLLAVPDVMGTFGPQIADIAAIEYQDLRSAAGITNRHTALVAPLPTPSRLDTLVRWAMGAVFSPTPNQQLGWSLLAGGMVKLLMDQQRQTMIDNAVDDIIDGPIGMQRVPRAGCCAFCAMLASRSASGADTMFGQTFDRGLVVGRGVPIENWYPGRPGRRPGGVRPRGSQEIGSPVHDHCRCRQKPVFRSTRVALERDAEGYLDEYLAARNALDERKVLDFTETKSEDGSLHRDYFWRDAPTGERLPDTQATQVLQWMRYQTGRK